MPWRSRWLALSLTLGYARVALVGVEGALKQGGDGQAAWTVQELFDVGSRLRHELAEVRTEISWLEHAPTSLNISSVDALARLEPLQREIASLRRDVAWLRRTEAASTSDEAGAVPVALRPPAPARAVHGRTVFVSMCAGSTYFDTYCGPFLASFERAYGAAASSHRVVVFVASVEARTLDVARERFAPWAAFRPLPSGGLTGETGEETYNTTVTGNSDNMVCTIEAGKLACNITDEGVNNRQEKTAKNNNWFPFHVSSYLREHGGDFCYCVLIDSDTLFVRPLGEFLPDYLHASSVADWDVGFTVYDEAFRVPWGDPTDVGRTNNGFARVNTGVVVLNLRDPYAVQRFLIRWPQATTWLASGGEDDTMSHAWTPHEQLQWLQWRDELLGEFRGPNQAGIVLLLCSYQTSRLQELLGWGPACGSCARTVEARLELFPDEPPSPVRFKALPACKLNHPESLPGGTFPSDVLVVHLKGLWWRTALPRGATFFVDDHRRVTWNRDSLALHRLCYETWHFALPPEDRPRNNFRVKDSEGNPVSNKELEEYLEMSRNGSLDLTNAWVCKKISS